MTPSTSRAAGLPAGLPAPDAEAQAHSARLAAYLRERMAAQVPAGLPFDAWMDAVLYAPGLGYYAAGSLKLDADLPRADFTTAPELTPLFGRTLARPVAQVLSQCAQAHILEFGAGTGRLAADLLDALREAGIAVVYHILELSPDLRERQEARLAAFGSQVRWLDRLPQAFEGCVLANEVLDAMPVQLFRWEDDGSLSERYVVPAGNAFAWESRPAGPALRAVVAARMPCLPGYASEINLRAEAWVRDLGRWLTRGAALLIDYGFPRHEYYHPQRHQGTLMCHYRHHSHADALALPGLQDVTAHVDFTAMADAARDGGLDVLGYTAQARFLIEAGLPAVLQAQDNATDPRMLSAVQTLLSEAEMGELFKVMALGRGLDDRLIGFGRGDRRHRL